MAGTGRMNAVMLMVTLVASMQLLGSMAQTSHVVGDTTGWIIPSTTSFYSTWAATQNFTVGDVLVFNFATGGHTVAEVTRTAYDACTIASPISIAVNGPANITLTAAGPHYFICTVGTHCSGGQRLAINVSAAATASPPATPPSVAPTPISPPTATPTPVSPPSATPTPVSPPSATPTPATPPPVSPRSSPPTPPPSSTPAGTTPAPSSPAGGSTAPPPPNSAVSVAMSALPVSLLSIAFALFY